MQATSAGMLGQKYVYDMAAERKLPVHLSQLFVLFMLSFNSLSTFCMLSSFNADKFQCKLPGNVPDALKFKCFNF